MKILPIINQVGYSTLVREKKEGDSSGQGQSGSESRKQKRNSQHSPDSEVLDQPSSEPPFSSTMSQAIDAFRDDLQTQAHGLNADLEGEGPGLKVILTDRSGGIIRRLSGEEFLKLREAAVPETRTCGKILDRKL